MGLAHWIARCTPFFSVSILLLLICSSLIWQPFGARTHGRHEGQATHTQRFLAFYIVLLHLAAWWFPIRLCWALFDLLRKLERKATEYVPYQVENHHNNARNADKSHGTTIHAILLPNYKEEIETLSDTLRVLSAHPMAERAYDVILAMEENETSARSKAQKLERDFAGRFRRLSHSMHPSNLEGETKGKSSNLSWAAKQAAAYYAQEPDSEVILTVMDADTHLLPYHFESISRLHIENPSTCESTMYVPPLIFDRNMHAIPLLVRLADTLWCGAGLSCLHSTSTVRIPTSVYSLPLSLAETVGGWDTGPESIGEDMHMYLKCALSLRGNLQTRVVYSPASQCNVASDEMGWRGYRASLVARYQQAIRHTWGALDVGFTLKRLWHLCRSSRRAAMDLNDVSSTLGGLSYTRLTKSVSVNKTILYSLDDHGTGPLSNLPVNLNTLTTIMHRLFEAHFLPVHLFILLSASAAYYLVCPPGLAPVVLRNALDISGWIRFASYLTMLLFFLLYRRYHAHCVEIRRKFLCEAGLLNEFEQQGSMSDTCSPGRGWIEMLLFPIAGIIFGSIPAMIVMACHLWTDRLVYVVSLKPRAAASLVERDVVNH